MKLDLYPGANTQRRTNFSDLQKWISSVSSNCIGSGNIGILILKLLCTNFRIKQMISCMIFYQSQCFGELEFLLWERTTQRQNQTREIQTL